MNNQNTDTNAQSKKWRSWLILFLRWLLGGIAGVWISSWFYFGLKNHASTGSFLWFGELLESVLAIPFVGHIYLFYPDTISYTNVNDFLTSFPVLIWGLISALLASGNKEQMRIGRILLVAYVIVGCISYIRFLIAIFRFF